MHRQLPDGTYLDLGPGQGHIRGMAISPGTLESSHPYGNGGRKRPKTASPRDRKLKNA